MRNLIAKNISNKTNFTVVHKLFRASDELCLIACVTSLHFMIILNLLYGRSIDTINIQNHHIPMTIWINPLSTILSINTLITMIIYDDTENDADSALYSNMGKNAFIPLPSASHTLCLWSFI